MPTIEELLSDTRNDNNEELNKLAEEIGLLESPETPMNKEAKMLHDLYLESFPGDADLLDQEKTAFDKTTALEEAMGEYAHDVFVDCLEGHIEKMAAELVEAHSDGSGHAHPQRFASNEDTSGKKIDTSPRIQDQLMGLHPEGAVGEFHHKDSPEGEQIKAAALRKHLLLSQLGG
jgi:hypothetical protein